jgi:hypothetical protein
MKVLPIDQDAMRACRAHFAEGDLLGVDGGQGRIEARRRQFSNHLKNAPEEPSKCETAERHPACNLGFEGRPTSSKRHRQANLTGDRILERNTFRIHFESRR